MQNDYFIFFSAGLILRPGQPVNLFINPIKTSFLIKIYFFQFVLGVFELQVFSVEV